MTEQQTFRTAFNGFHRDDVVRYIEQINTKHASEISSLKSEIQHLQDKLDQCEMMAAEAEASTELEQKVEEQAAALLEQTDRIAQLEQQLHDAQDAAQAAESLLEEAENDNNRLQGLLDAALARQAGAQSQQSAELSAYRRAERVERQAKERAQQVHDQVNGALADATVKVDEAAAQIAAMTNDALQQLKQLQLAISGGKQILQDAAASLYAIRPITEEE